MGTNERLVDDMIHIQSLRQGLPIYKALGSETHIAIVELLVKEGPMRMTTIAETLKITGGALTSHVKMLEEAGLILVDSSKGRHGIQKICQVNDKKIVIDSPFSKSDIA